MALQYFDAKITYQSLFDRVEVCARALLAVGITCGDCFTVCSSGIPETVALILAASKTGAVANMLNPTFQTAQMIDRINETGAKILFVMDKMYSFVKDAIGKTLGIWLTREPAPKESATIFRKWNLNLMLYKKS